MGNYEYWMYDDKPIEYVMKSHYDQKSGKITLNCFTEGDSLNDPRVIISGWKEYESMDESRNPGVGGHVIVQTSRTQTKHLTNAIQNFRAVLSNLSYKETDIADKIIFFDMEFTVGDVAFIDKYGKKYPIDEYYDNIIYNEFMDDLTERSRELGEYFGHITIVEEHPITRVDIYGGAYIYPSWVEVNGDRRYWHYNYDDRIEKLIFQLDEPNDTVVITSPNYIAPPTNLKYSKSKINAICTFYDENFNILASYVKGM
ncbi:MAG: hypothetical protein QHH15_00545 [Candidatus Thermoplasmatota archaeon]|nr:hypothetical protein [Candidatus Thermoplasmatota archaeon]MDH7506263.1 hypothetical protein [Candidatus Thermoplasmatota archaeon]